VTDRASGKSQPASKDSSTAAAKPAADYKASEQQEPSVKNKVASE
jgi:hypothetical protein